MVGKGIEFERKALNELKEAYNYARRHNLPEQSKVSRKEYRRPWKICQHT